MKYEIEHKESKVWVTALRVQKDLKFSPYLRSMWKQKITDGLDKDAEIYIAETDTLYEVYISVDENCSAQDINALCQTVEVLTDQFLEYHTNLLKFVKENWEV